MQLSQFLIPLAMVVCGIAVYDLVRGQPEDRASPQGLAPVDDQADSGEGSGRTQPSFEPAPQRQSPRFDDARIAKLEQVVAALRSELASTRADLLALEVSRAREQRAAPDHTTLDHGTPADTQGVETPDISTMQLDHFEALVAASRRRAETRNFARAIAGRLPKLPIDLTEGQRRQLLDLTLEFRSRSSGLELEGAREGLRREMDGKLGGIVEGRDAQIVSELLVNAAVPPPLPSAGSANTGNR